MQLLRVLLSSLNESRTIYLSKNIKLAFSAEDALFPNIFWTILATPHDLPDPLLPNIHIWFANKSFILGNTSYPGVANSGGGLQFPRGAHTTVGGWRTMGLPKGGYKQAPNNFYKKGINYER